MPAEQRARCERVWLTREQKGKITDHHIHPSPGFQKAVAIWNCKRVRDQRVRVKSPTILIERVADFRWRPQLREKDLTPKDPFTRVKPRRRPRSANTFHKRGRNGTKCFG